MTFVGQDAERRPEPVDAVDRRERVVDAGREGPHGDLDELVDGELDVLRQGAPGAEVEGPADRVGELVVDPIAGPGPREVAALEEELPRALPDGEHDVMLPGQLQEAVDVDRLEVVASRGRDRPRLAVEGVGEVLLPRSGRRLGGLLAQALGIEPVDRLVQVAAHRGDDVLGLDRLGRVVDEVDQDPEARRGPGAARP